MIIPIQMVLNLRKNFKKWMDEKHQRMWYRVRTLHQSLLQFHIKCLQIRFWEFMPIYTFHTYWKSDYVNLKLWLWLLGVELVVANGVHWISGEGLFVSHQIMESKNDTWWQIFIDAGHYAIQINPHTYIGFKDANCAWKDKNILFLIKLDTWICVPQFYNFIIII
jgi:hypothetical protein